MSSFRPPERSPGEEALARGAWAEAREAFEAALRVDETAEALEGLGNAAWWLDLAGVVFDARARIELARAQCMLGRVEEASEEARRAIDLFSELKAELETERAQCLLDALERPKQPVETPIPGSRRNTGLTGRQLEVLRLVAEGFSNQRIAERLFLSDHTIHRHLANILGKLSVSTRAAAVAQAVRRGLLA